MSELGLTLVWLAVQVAFVLGPALVLHAVASRRGPASGAWVAALSLGLVVALSAAACVPFPARTEKSLLEANAVSSPAADDGRAITTTAASALFTDLDQTRPTAGPRWSLARLRAVWIGLELGAAAPVARFRPWAVALAVVWLAGALAGVLRLTIGLWAVDLCRRRGRPVNDPAMTGLLEELRGSMGIRRKVELRQVPDLTTPATAGWLRPVLLLPCDWRTWQTSDRRAVFAHELAHIIRGDYTAGLLARLAVMLNFYHPMVLWMASRLQLQQELAADAIGARFAGGRASYLVALSRLALSQDGRSSWWPARAFLPAPGTLIRRIAMLRDGSEMGSSERPWPGRFACWHSSVCSSSRPVWPRSAARFAVPMAIRAAGLQKQ